MRHILFYAFFIGTFIINAQDSNYTKQIELASSPEEAWQLITDVSQWKHWDSHVVDAQLKGDFLASSKGVIVTTSSKVVDFEIVSLDQGKSFTLRHQLSSGMVYLKRSVESLANGSVVKLEVWYKRLSNKNFRKYMGEDFDLVLEKELQNFVALIK